MVIYKKKPSKYCVWIKNNDNNKQTLFYSKTSIKSVTILFVILHFKIDLDKWVAAGLFDWKWKKCLVQFRITVVYYQILNTY